MITVILGHHAISDIDTKFMMMWRWLLFELTITWISLKATARWWFSRTDSSLYIRANSEPELWQIYPHRFKRKFNHTYMIDICIITKKKISPVFTRYWLVTPGWSTSWIQLARIAANTSKGENTWRNTWSKVLQSTSFMEFIKITNIILIIVLKPLPAQWSREGCGWTVSHLLHAGGCDKECPAKLISK